MPLVSVIVPNYNYSQYLSKRIDSILNQTFGDFELIILDDASTDNSIEIINNYAQRDNRIRCIYNTKNTGSPFLQWKKGIELAKGKYIWIAEADDFADSNFIQTCLNYLRDDNLAFVFTQSFVVDEQDQILDLYKLQYSEYDKIFGFYDKRKILNAFIRENIVPNASAVLFRKDVYYEIGGVDVSLHPNADWLLWFKMALYYNIFFCKEPLNFFRRHAKSVIASAKQATNYVQMYDFSLRIRFKAIMKDNTELFNIDTIKFNNTFIAYDLGNYSLWLVEHGKFFNALWPLFRSTLMLKSLGFVRKFFKKLFKFSKCYQ